MARGHNIDYRKKQKKNMILNIIRTNEFSSRSSIKTQSGYSMESVLQYVEELLQEGLIYESGMSDFSVGRKATWLKVNPLGCYFLGVKINANSVIGVIMDFSGNIIVEKSFSLHSGANANELVSLIMKCIAELLALLNDDQKKVFGIGIGVPGLVDRDKGISVRYAHIKSWETIKLQEIIEKEFEIKTYIEQSVKVATLSLKLRPENANIRNLIYIYFGRGIGMAVIANNEVFRGNNNSAGELGHLYVANNGIQCECGKYGCLETEASSLAVVQKIETGLKAGKFTILKTLLKEERQPEMEDFLLSLELKDPDSLQLLKNIEKYTFQAVSTVVTLLDPEKLIIAGYVGKIAGFTDRLKQDIIEKCPIEAARSISIELLHNDDMFYAASCAKLALYNQFYSGLNV
jgi:N-acetylglucosamine repressor